ncbi:hypothetical protein JGK46_003430 [Aeromonas bestiarum]|nr:hypothetical protein [Aeromonas bestiarum]
MSFFEIFLAIIALAFIALIYSTYIDYKKKKNNIQELNSSGFKFDHHMKGSLADVVVDVGNGSAAFVCPKRIKKVSLSDFRQWQHTFVEKNTVKNGAHRHSLENNAIEFTINDTVEPLIRVPVANYDYAREWVARFSAIING